MDRTCSQCQKSSAVDDMVAFGEDWVCAECKPTYVQKLKEGVTTTIRVGGPPKQKRRGIERGTWFFRIWAVLTVFYLLAVALAYFTGRDAWSFNAAVFTPTMAILAGLWLYENRFRKRLGKFRDHIAVISDQGTVISVSGQSQDYSWDDLEGYRYHNFVVKAVSVYDRQGTKIFAFACNSDEAMEFKASLAKNLPEI